MGIYTYDYLYRFIFLFEELFNGALKMDFWKSWMDKIVAG